jgi:RNA polymerase sigma factor (sigma-70 family)
MEPTDAILVERCVEGQTEAFGDLVRRHQDGVFNLLFKMTGNWHDADELTQEAFLRAYRQLGAYDARYAFRNWVTTIAVNLTKNWFRSLFRRRRAEDSAAREQNGAHPAPVVADARLAAVQEAVAGLPLKWRTPLVLRHMEGYSYEEIAHTLGIGVSAAKMRVQRAREAILLQLRSTPEEKSPL